MAYKIVVDAAHGGADPGAVYDGRQEKDDTLSLARKVGELLKDYGIDVLFTRTTDVYQTPFEKAQIANNADADFFISIHRNSSEDPNQYEGVETLVYDKSGVKLEMAEAVDQALADLGFKNLGVKERPGLVVLRRTKMPAILIEAGFLNNDGDNALFDQTQDEMAQAIADAVASTLGIAAAPPAMDETISGAPGSSHMPSWDSSMNGTASGVPGTPGMNGMTPGAPGMNGTVPGAPGMNGTVPDSSRPGQDPTDMPETLYRVQVGLYRVRQNADNMLYELQEKGYPAFILNEDGYYKVQVGAYRQLGNAITMERNLRRAGYSTFITT
ncbi:MAG TPA: N-acetylmuramoyl-L-alanine amidase [Candidatus Fusicatenibacter merdavium]|uniref:N-acetylmuramoyl-L-alanine amidase n=1 Tax=Candidatus Fusicatenibacter merdavium TaxID=2838600 RepID=A0A9D1XD99_9FIRM|nr:N-acetylmuramoyl-L-alanine amidase [Candidatus Fusicatenibacter merdavium]